MHFGTFQVKLMELFARRLLGLLILRPLATDSFHHFGDVSRDSGAFWTPGVPQCLRDLRVYAVNDAMLAEFIYPHGDRWLTGNCRESAAETLTESLRVSRWDRVLAEIYTQTASHLSVYSIVIHLQDCKLEWQWKLHASSCICTYTWTLFCNLLRIMRVCFHTETSVALKMCTFLHTFFKGTET